MKAPDKIYTNNRGGYAKIPIFSQADANVEYIRKDALMEWAKENIDSLGRLSYGEFLDKLNSM